MKPISKGSDDKYTRRDVITVTFTAKEPDSTDYYLFRVGKFLLDAAFVMVFLFAPVIRILRPNFKTKYKSLRFTGIKVWIRKEPLALIVQMSALWISADRDTNAKDWERFRRDEKRKADIFKSDYRIDSISGLGLSE